MCVEKFDLINAAWSLTDCLPASLPDANELFQPWLWKRVNCAFHASFVLQPLTGSNLLHYTQSLDCEEETAWDHSGSFHLLSAKVSTLCWGKAEHIVEGSQQHHVIDRVSVQWIRCCSDFFNKWTSLNMFFISARDISQLSVLFLCFVFLSCTCNACLCCVNHAIQDKYSLFAD